MVADGKLLLKEKGTVMEKNRVEVVIDGHIITLVSDDKESYLQKVGLYIDRKLAEVKASMSNKPITEHLRTLLIAVNIADEYFKEQEKGKELERTHKAYVHEMGRMQEENHMLSEKLHEMQAQLSYVREQYIKEVGQLQEDSGEMSELRQEASRLADANRDLQEQLQYARRELEEYISTFDSSEDRQNVVNFSATQR